MIGISGETVGDGEPVGLILGENVGEIPGEIVGETVADVFGLPVFSGIIDAAKIHESRNKQAPAARIVFLNIN